MMLAMLNKLRKKGFARASLAVQKANVAERMYEKVGFHTVSENEEEYIMVCNLKEDVFSKVHLDWYRNNPEDYIAKMKGTDRDLAAHITVIRARGVCLCGAPIDEVFGEVPKQDYIDSLWHDIADAEGDIAEDTMYLTLNLARVLAFLQDGSVLSKKEGGEWGLKNLPEKYHGLLREALSEYRLDQLLLHR